MKCSIFTCFILLSGFVFFTESKLFSQDSLIFDVLEAEDIKPLINNNEIEIISASRSSKKLEDLPVTTHVITHEEIIRNGYTTLVDVLKSIPGIRVSQPGSGEAGEMFEMRGLVGNNYTKILINNLPIKPSVVSGMSLNAQLPIRQAERIEVIFGPASAIYGADATAGVINIITREAENGIFSSADISIGGNGYRYINFQAGGKAGKNKNILKYSFYGSQSLQDSLNIFNDAELYKPLSYLDQTDPGFDINGVHYFMSDLTNEMARQTGFDTLMPQNYEGSIEKPLIKAAPLESRLIGFELKFRGWSLSYQNMYRKSHSSIGLTPFLFKYNNPLNFIEQKIDNIVISYDKQFRYLRSTTNLQYLGYELDNNSNFGTTWGEENGTYYIYSSSYDFYLEQLFTYTGKKLEIVSGITLQVSANVPQTNYASEPFDKDLINFGEEGQTINDPVFGNFGFNPRNYYNFSGFVQGYYVTGKLTLVGGARFDDTRYYSSSTNVRLAALYKLGNRTILRTSGGTAYKAPAPNTTYYSIAYQHQENPDSIYYAFIPNENLRPELSFAFELGLRRKFFDNVFLDISLFQNSIKDLIISDVVDEIDMEKYPKAANDPEDKSRTNRNSDNALSVISGSEISLRINNLIPAIQLNTEISFTVSQRRETTDHGELLKTINKSPVHTGKMKISMVPLKKTYASLEGNWASSWNRSYFPSADYYVNKDYPLIPGYFTLDGVFSIKPTKNLNFFIKIINMFDANYAGIDASGLDIDLRYNPQYGRNVRVGLSFTVN